jgi:hypothetical protein
MEEEDQHNQDNIENNKSPRRVNHMQERIKHYIKITKITRISVYPSVTFSTLNVNDLNYPSKRQRLMD